MVHPDQATGEHAGDHRTDGERGAQPAGGRRAAADEQTPIAGNSTRGMAKIIAIRSTMNVIRTFGRVAR